MTALAAEIRERIRRDGTAQRRHLHGALPVSPDARLLPPRPAHRRCRRLHHRARGEPDVRRVDRALVRGGMADHGPAPACGLGRARSGPRHAAGRCAACRRDGAALSRCHRGASGRVERNPARRAGRPARRRPADLARAFRDRTARPGARHCERILRCLADPSVRADRRKLARAGRHARAVIRGAPLRRRRRTVS